MNNSNGKKSGSFSRWLVCWIVYTFLIFFTAWSVFEIPKESEMLGRIRDVVSGRRTREVAFPSLDDAVKDLQAQVKSLEEENQNLKERQVLTEKVNSSGDSSSTTLRPKTNDDGRNGQPIEPQTKNTYKEYEWPAREND